MKTIQGVLPVFQTPYDNDESIDFDTLTKEIDWLIEKGADGIVMAMVSETLRLSADERKALAKATTAAVQGRGVSIISVGAESSKVAEEYARHAESIGADAVMAIPPISVAAGDDELKRYYERILNAIAIPVIVQDASGYVGRPMSIAMQAELFNTWGERILFKPEASPIGPRLSALLEATQGKAPIFEGSGGIALVDSYQRGVVGTMPGAEVIDALVALWRALKAGDSAVVDRISLPLIALVSLQTSLDSFLAVEKHILSRRGIFKNTRVRGPVGFVLDEQTRREVDRLLDMLLATL
jgi:dihydrodipicolinate synthase/N-acetylneuraminate lyase